MPTDNLIVAMTLHLIVDERLLALRMSLSFGKLDPCTIDRPAAGTILATISPICQCLELPKLSSFFWPCWGRLREPCPQRQSGRGGDCG